MIQSVTKDSVWSICSNGFETTIRDGRFGKGIFITSKNSSFF